MYPNLSAQGEISGGNGNHVSEILAPWNLRVCGFNARTDSFISSGNFSSGTRAGLIWSMTARSLSTETVGLMSRSFKRFRRSMRGSFFEVVNPFGTEVFLMNSASCNGISAIRPGALSGGAAFLVCFFAGAVGLFAVFFPAAVFFVAIFVSSVLCAGSGRHAEMPAEPGKSLIKRIRIVI